MNVLTLSLSSTSTPPNPLRTIVLVLMKQGNIVSFSVVMKRSLAGLRMFPFAVSSLQRRWSGTEGEIGCRYELLQQGSWCVSDLESQVYIPSRTCLVLGKWNDLSIHMRRLDHVPVFRLLEYSSLCILQRWQRSRKIILLHFLFPGVVPAAYWIAWEYLLRLLSTIVTYFLSLEHSQLHSKALVFDHGREGRPSRPYVGERWHSASRYTSVVICYLAAQDMGASRCSHTRLPLYTPSLDQCCAYSPQQYWWTPGTKTWSWWDGECTDTRSTERSP